MNFFKKGLLKGLYVALFSKFLYLIILYIGSINNYDPIDIIKDPAGLKSSQFLFGFISKLNVVLWIIAGSIALFSSRNKIIKQKEFQSFLKIGAIYSFYLSISDFADLHQFKQNISYSIIVLVSLIILLKYYLIIKQISLFLFFLVCFFLGLSLIIDLFQSLIIGFSYENIQIIEEGMKFIGSFLWLYFWIKTSSLALIYKR